MHEPNIEDDTTTSLCQVTETVLSLKREDLKFQDVQLLILSAKNMDYLPTYFEKFLQLPLVDHDELLSLIWAKIIHYVEWYLRHVVNGYRDLEESPWFLNMVACLRIFVGHGGDVHQERELSLLVYGPPCSAYNLVLQLAEHPFDADLAVTMWLKALTQSGIQLRPYLEREKQHLQHCWNGSDHIAPPRILSTIAIEGIQTLSWRWTWGPHCSASGVLNEFQYFESEVPQAYYSPLDLGSWDHLRWLRTYYDRGNWTNFPFTLRNLDVIPDLNPITWTTNHSAGHTLALQIRQKRHKQQEVRQWRRAHPGQRLPTDKMLLGMLMGRVIEIVKTHLSTAHNCGRITVERPRVSQFVLNRPENSRAAVQALFGYPRVGVRYFWMMRGFRLSLSTKVHGCSPRCRLHFLNGPEDTEDRRRIVAKLMQWNALGI